MRLTKQQKRGVQAWVQDIKCPTCSEGKWRAEETKELGEMLGNRQRPGFIHVVLPIVCEHCGYTMVFDWGQLEPMIRGRSSR